MQITEERKDHTMLLEITGRIDNNTAPTLDEEISKWLSSPVIWKIELDFSKVEYISSACVRVLLSAQKKKKESHELIIKNPSPFCRQVFDITGADIFLTIV